MSGHTYASLAEFKSWLTGPDPGTDNDATLVPLLESASRAVDFYCNRSRFGSGFGPRVGTNHYTGESGRCLWLDDDVLTLTSLNVAYATGATPVSYTENTDYYAVPYDRSPKRRLDAIETSALFFGRAQRGIAVAGTFGYANDTVAMSATTNEALDTSETGVDVTSGTAFSPGQTLLIDSEQMYVTGVSTNTLTVVRGANGTTAATHLTAAAISRYLYHPSVVEATRRLTQKRWKARDAGLDGAYSPAEGVTVGFRETERALLRSLLSNLRCVQDAEGHLAEVGPLAP